MAIVAGLLLVGTFVLLGALAAVVGPKARWLGLTIALVAGCLWFVAFLAFLGLLSLERFAVGPYSMVCPVPRNDSAYATSHWSWFPPGAVCEYRSGDVGPTYWRIPALVTLVAAPVAAMVIWPERLRKRVRDRDDASHATAGVVEVGPT